MPNVIVPVGTPMGFGLGLPGDGPDWSVFHVRIGDRMIGLGPAELSAWTLVRTDFEAHERLEVSRSWLIEALGREQPPIDDAETIVASLVKEGLLVEFDTDGPLQQVFSRHRLVPLGDGLGADSDEPGTFWVEKANVRLVGLRQDVYMMWAFGGWFANMWEACEFYKEQGTLEDTLSITADEIATQLAEAVPTLVATGASALDVGR
jgi:hypothetical protein